MFFKKVKKELEAVSNVQEGELSPHHFKWLTEDLYKRNAELAIRNKTLQLLGKLYEITIGEIEPRPIVNKMTQVICSGLSFELVAVLINEGTGLKLMSISRTDVLDESESELFQILEDNPPNESRFINAESAPFVIYKSLKDLWSNVSIEKIDYFEKKSKILTVAVYPLALQNKKSAYLILSLNRPYVDLTSFEVESINSFTNVITVALDKAYIYKELKETNTKLINLNERLKELDKQKTEFVSFATHQLRSPLTAMKGYSSLILEGDYGELNPDLRNAVQRISDSTNTLATVVDDYLNISRIELGTMKYSYHKIDFNELVGKILAEMMPSIEKAGLSLSYMADKKQSYNIDADPDKFKQVILNLIDNALKYTQKGSIALSMEKKPNRTILFTIKDTGIGMSQETIPKLFQKFSRADKASEVNIRGTGLGLYVAKEIIAAHGGKIWAESEGVGKGSQFYVEIPER